MTDFPFEPGHVTTKMDIHRTVGGSSQHAMTSCLSRSAFLLFYDPKESGKNGYDLWEGEQADGTFCYTGQGLNGDQRMRGPNLGLLRAAEENRPIHFFRRPDIGIKRVKGNPYTYIGKVMLGDPKFEVRLAPGQDGRSRSVFVFRLIPVGHGHLNPRHEGALAQEIRCDFRDSPILPEIAQPGTVNATITSAELEENKIQNRFRAYISQMGERAETVDIKLGDTKGVLRPDFILRNRGLVVEVKPSTSREHVRLAIGQVLDYAYLLKKRGYDLTPAILLPEEPNSDLKSLAGSVGIKLIIERGDGKFEFL